MQRRQFIRTLSSAAAAGLALPALGQTERKLVLGQSAALSGPAAELGLQFRRGARLYFERLNAKGGVNGRIIELKSLDDGYEPDRCKDNTDKLIREEVFALFGYIGTPTSLAALPMATNAKLPFLAPFTGAQALREPFNRYAFHVRASYFDETERIVNQLTSVGMKKIAVFHQNDSYGQAGLDGVRRAMKPRGLEPMVTVTVERNSVDVDAAVRALVTASPEAIVQISAYKSCAACVRLARKSGYSGGFYNVSFVGTQALGHELGAEARGVVISQVMPYPYAPVSPLAGEYIAAIQAVQQPGFERNYTSMEGYVAAKVFAEGLRRTGPNPSREDLVAGLESLREYDLGGFFVDFNARKHTGSSFAEMTILTQDGKVRR